MRGLLDTSIFIAQEAGRPVGPLPEESLISVVTVAELHAGVLLAADEQIRARRLLTLSHVEESFDALPIDVEVSRVFASIYAQARAQGRQPQAMDLWIAATAVRHGLVLFTHDHDFDGIPRVQVNKS